MLLARARTLTRSPSSAKPGEGRGTPRCGRSGTFGRRAAGSETRAERKAGQSSSFLGSGFRQNPWHTRLKI